MDRPIRIVLADDHPVVRIGVRNMLTESEGFEVVGDATDGDEAITETLEKQPDILLLDEPFGALDSLTRTRLQNEFLRIWEHEGITMVMVTHDVEEAVFLSDRIAVIEPRPGRVNRLLDVRLDRPRRRSDPAFVALKEEILADLNTAEQ